jgi:hypothetical protein
LIWARLGHTQSTNLHKEASSFSMYHYIPAKVSQIPKTPVLSRASSDGTLALRPASAVQYNQTTQTSKSDAWNTSSIKVQLRLLKYCPCLRTLHISPISRFCNLDCAVPSIRPSIPIIPSHFSCNDTTRPDKSTFFFPL